MFQRRFSEFLSRMVGLFPSEGTVSLSGTAATGTGYKEHLSGERKGLIVMINSQLCQLNQAQKSHFVAHIDVAHFFMSCHFVAHFVAHTHAY